MLLQFCSLVIHTQNICDSFRINKKMEIIHITLELLFSYGFYAFGNVIVPLVLVYSKLQHLEEIFITIVIL